MVFGVLLTLAAGIMSGNCMLPMKFVRRWHWENTWLLFSVVSLLVLPWLLGFSLVHHLTDVYRLAPLAYFVPTVLFGIGWGIAQVLFGITIRRLGLGLGYAIVVGLGAVLGTLIPLFARERKLVSAASLGEVAAGVAVMMLGIGVNAWAGNLRERPLTGLEKEPDVLPKAGYAQALLLAILCGFMAPMLNFAFAFGQPLAEQAQKLGNSAVVSGYAIWPIGLLGGLLPNVAYSLYLLQKNGTWKLFGNVQDSARPLLMSVLWMGAFSLYGMGSVYLGTLGTSVGWGMMQIFMIMTATFSGVLTGEWRSANSHARRLLGAGLFLLTGATVLLALGSNS